MSRLLAETGFLARFGLVGILSNLTLYAVFVAMIWAGIGAAVAAGLCYIIGFCLNYLLHRKFTFKSKAAHSSDLPRYLAAYGAGFAATLIFISVFTNWMRAEYAQLLNMVATALVIYITMRLLRVGREGH